MARKDWNETVELMRADVREIAMDPQHAARAISRVQYALDGMTAQMRRGWGLNAHEMLAVNLLWEHGRMTMTQLGRRIPLSRAAVTTLTDRLEQLGYVKRVPDVRDRRRVLLEITERMEREAGRLQEQWRGRIEEYVRGLDPETWQAAVSVLADLREMAHEESARLGAEDDATLARLATGGKARSKVALRREERGPETVTGW